MARISTLVLFVLIIVGTTSACAQEQDSPAHAIGKRVELTVNHKNGDGEFTCVGIVTQVDQKRLILEKVTKTEMVDRGVPFLSNIRQQDKVFTNVGLNKTVELEFGIVLQLVQIKSWRLAEPKDNELLRNEAAELELSIIKRELAYRYGLESLSSELKLADVFQSGIDSAEIPVGYRREFANLRNAGLKIEREKKKLQMLRNGLDNAR